MKWWRKRFHRYYDQVIAVGIVVVLLYWCGLIYVGYLAIKALLKMIAGM